MVDGVELVIVEERGETLVQRAVVELRDDAADVVGGLGLAILAIFPDLLVEISDWFGIGYPPATFMLLALSFLLVLVLHFSWELSRLEDRTRALAEEYALLRGEIEERLGPREDTR